MFSALKNTVGNGLKSASSHLMLPELEEKIKPYMDDIKGSIKRECPEMVQTTLMSDVGSQMVAGKIYPFMPLPLQFLVNEEKLAGFLKNNAEYLFT